MRSRCEPLFVAVPAMVSDDATKMVRNAFSALSVVARANVIMSLDNAGRIAVYAH